MRINISIGIFLILTLSIVNAKYDEERAKDFLFASALAYCPPMDVSQYNCKAASVSTVRRGMAGVYSYDNRNTNDPIYMAILDRSSKKELIVAFSGTIHSSQLLNELKSSLPVDYTTHDVPNARVFEYFYMHYTNTFRDAMLGDLKALLKKSQYRNYKVVFTGHSLGGALAMHGAADAIHSGLLEGHKIELWTYGQPRIGNKEFLDSFVDKIDQYYRIVNNRDVVAHLPPCISLFRGRCGHDGILPWYPYHAPTEVFYKNNMSEYTLCSSTDGEDESCSNGISNISVDDHKSYWGIAVGSYHLQDESAISDFLTYENKS